MRPYNTGILEAEVEKETYDYGRDHCETHHQKNTAKGRRNVPDQLFINKHGFIYFIEFKRWKKKPTEGQEREIKRLRDRGVKVYVVDNYIYGRMIMDYHKDTRISVC